MNLIERLVGGILYHVPVSDEDDMSENPSGKPPSHSGYGTALHRM